MIDPRPLSAFKFTQEEYDLYQSGVEIWRDVEGYENVYQISTNGRVKSLARVIHRSSHTMTIVEKIKKLHIGNTGYYGIGLNYYGARKTFKINRLVCLAFLNNPDNKPCTNHLDGNKLNNFLVNFEWATFGENNYHALKTGLRLPAHLGKFGKDNHSSKKVNQYDMNGNFIKLFYGGEEAARELGLWQANISACALGKLKSTGGFIWKYAEDC